MRKDKEKFTRALAKQFLIWGTTYSERRRRRRRSSSRGGGEEEEVVVEGDGVTDEGDGVKADPEDGLPIPGEWYPGAGWKPDDSELGEHQSWIATSDTINGETVYKWEKVGETDAEYAARKQREALKRQQEALKAKNLELQQKNEALQYMGQENIEDVCRT